MTSHKVNLSCCRFCGPECPVGAGKCHCACGALAPIAGKNRPERGVKAGYPQLFIRGHAMHNRKHTNATRKKMAISQARALNDSSILARRIAQVKATGFQPSVVHKKWHIQKRTKTYYKFRQGIWDRDGSACTKCGSTEKLHLHHFISRTARPDLRFDPGNVITLCHSCHMREEANIKHAIRRSVACD